MRRSVVLLLVVVLALATGLALLAAGATLADPGIAPLPPDAAARAELVRRYYAAVNDAIRTGATAPLDAVVAPWFDDGAAGAETPTREEFTRYLAGLHRASPDARVAVEEIVAGMDGATVLARVTVVGLSLADPAPRWGPLDAFRIAGGMLVERRNAGGGAVLAAPILRADLPALPPAVTGLVLVRLTFAPGAASPQLLSAGPTILAPEAGSIGLAFVPGERQRESAAVEPERTLRPGDFEVVSPGVRYSLRNAGTVPAVVLGWTLVMPPESTAWDGHPGDAAGVAAAPFLPHDLSTGAGQPWGTVEVLASGEVGRWPAGPVTVAVGRAVLGPGATLAQRASETALLAVERGGVTVEGQDIAGGAASGSSDSPVGPSRHEDHCRAVTRTLAAGDSACLPARAAARIRNAGAGPAVLLTLTITPAEASIAGASRRG